MKAGRLLRQARRRAGLTQRELAERAGVPQPSIARIEAGRVVPGFDTLDALLKVCGEELEARRRLGEGVDRTLIHRLLELTPGERARLSVEEARNVERFLEEMTS